MAVTEEQLEIMKNSPLMQEELQQYHDQLERINSDLSDPNSHLYKALQVAAFKQDIQKLLQQSLQMILTNVENVIEELPKIVKTFTRFQTTADSAGEKDDFVNDNEQAEKDQVAFEQFIQSLRQNMRAFIEATKEIGELNNSIQQDEKDLATMNDALEVTREINKMGSAKNQDHKGELSQFGKKYDEYVAEKKEGAAKFLRAAVIKIASNKTIAQQEEARANKIEKLNVEKGLLSEKLGNCKSSIKRIESILANQPKHTSLDKISDLIQEVSDLNSTAERVARRLSWIESELTFFNSQHKESSNNQVKSRTFNMEPKQGSKSKNTDEDKKLSEQYDAAKKQKKVTEEKMQRTHDQTNDYDNSASLKM